MTDAVLSLGSNLGDRAEHLATAVRALGNSVRAVSSIYRTPPWGPVEQDDFYNCVVLVDDENTDARGWLGRSHEIEEAAGRVRDVRWGPRTLDVDVIVVGDEVSDEPHLILPHPRAHQRGFVLVPWAELDPAATLPGHGDVEALLATLPVDEVASIVRIGPLHLGRGRHDG